MAELDFSRLNGIAYRGFDTPEEQEKKDALIEQGYSLIENDTENPFKHGENKASEPSQAASSIKLSTTLTQASEGLKTAFKRTSNGQGYNVFYRAAHDYHERHTPPTVDREYWRTHIAGEDEPPKAELDYWEEAATDVSATARAYGNDPFLTGLLVAVYEELTREYTTLKRSITA